MTGWGGPAVPAGRRGRDATRGFIICDHFQTTSTERKNCELNGLWPIVAEWRGLLSLRDPTRPTHAVGPPESGSATNLRTHPPLRCPILHPPSSILYPLPSTLPLASGAPGASSPDAGHTCHGAMGVPQVVDFRPVFPMIPRFSTSRPAAGGRAPVETVRTRWPFVVRRPAPAKRRPSPTLLPGGSPFDLPDSRPAFSIESPRQ